MSEQKRITITKSKYDEIIEYQKTHEPQMFEKDNIITWMGYIIDVIDDDYVPFINHRKDIQIDNTPRNRKERRHGRII